MKRIPLTVTFALALFLTGCLARSRPNIVLIVIDTLRADHLSCYGYERPTSPRLDALAERAVLFESAAAVAPYTRASTASILTGVYPSVHGAITNDQDVISPTVQTLAEALQETGYRTHGFSRNANVRRAFGFARGFDTFERPAKPLSEKLKAEKGDDFLWREIDDSVLTRRVSEVISDLKSAPFFLYLHYQGAHDPYTPPREFMRFLELPLTPTARKFYDQKAAKGQNVFADMEKGIEPLDELTRQQIVGLYDSEIAFVDDQVGQILDALAEAGLDENTLVVVTADHGEELWDHGGMGHGRSLYQELLHVPLIFAGPEMKPRRIAEPVSLIDVTPTLMELAGLNPPHDLTGQSLAPVLRNRRQPPPENPIYAEGFTYINYHGDPLFYRSLRTGDQKLIVDFQHKRKMLFDLAADPGEERELLSEETPGGNRLLRDLAELHHRNLASPYLSEMTRVDVPADLRENLEALGYVAGPEEDPLPDLFRRPLRSLESGAFGFTGIEREGADYRPRLDFSQPDFPEEQLLYGWANKRPGQKRQRALRTSGVRLKRLAEHTGWRVVGRVADIGGEAHELDLTIRIDGGPAATHQIRTASPFELTGDLPAGDKAYARFDLECDRAFFAHHGERTDEHAHCLTVDAFEVR